ncbi:MAG: 16S rRNA (adenine(1518)-N(6)/adenine(1519)-N(6))-dimethyltransferase RsmA [Flavobacteriales bacterium]
MYVKPKKHLGQHFLHDKHVCERIANSLMFAGKSYTQLVEIGPGTGALTAFLIPKKEVGLAVVEIDRESIEYLHIHYPELIVLDKDFLKLELSKIFKGPVGIIGNFPYNISSQILFRVYEQRAIVPEVVGMFQKEVAQRVASGPGNKDYGILSVLLQAFYDIEYLFSVDEGCFTPPPKVKSGVIRLIRNKTEKLSCDENRFKLVVKTAFNQRRKTLRNSLKSITDSIPEPFSQKRPEQLSPQEFIELTTEISPA